MQELTIKKLLKKDITLLKQVIAIYFYLYLQSMDKITAIFLKFTFVKNSETLGKNL